MTETGDEASTERVEASGAQSAAVQSNSGVIVTGQGATIHPTGAAPQRHGNRALAIAIALTAFVAGVALMAGTATLIVNTNNATSPGAHNGMPPTPSTSPPSSPTGPSTPTPSPRRSSPAPKPEPKHRRASRTGHPPGPVTGLHSAMIYPGSTQTVTARWNPQSDATSFDVHYTTTGSPQHKSVDTITNTTAKSYDFTAYHDETSCMYVRARNRYGVSRWSSDDGACFNV